MMLSLDEVGSKGSRRFLRECLNWKTLSPVTLE